MPYSQTFFSWVQGLCLLATGSTIVFTSNHWATSLALQSDLNLLSFPFPSLFPSFSSFLP